MSILQQPRWGDPEGWRGFYRAIAGSDPDSYLLEKMDLYKTDVELVEVNK